MEIARAIATRFCGAAPYTIDAIEGLGSVNQLFVASTAVGRIIIRLPQESDKWRAEAFYEKERWCLESARRIAHIPGPEVLEQGVFEGWPYQIQRYIEGVNGERSDIPPAQLYYSLGEYSRRFHTISLTGFGEVLADFQAPDGRERWHEFITYNLESLTDGDPLLGLGVYLPDQRQAIYERFKSLYALDAPIGLTHGDLAPRNTIVTSDQTVVLIDWGCAEAHLIPHYDLYYMPRDFQHDFLNGYGWPMEQRAALFAELESLALLKAFDLVRWSLDRCLRRLLELAEEARKLAQAVA